jgi:hypothetical protein
MAETPPKNVVLVSTPRTVSPRSPILSDKYNATVKETNNDLSNIKVQLNAITKSALRLNSEAWETEKLPTEEGIHGMDAYTIYWDARPNTEKFSIKEVVEAGDESLKNQIDDLTASNIFYDTTLVSDPNLPDMPTGSNVQDALDLVINTLPILMGEEDITVNLSDVIIDEPFVPGTTSHTIGTDLNPWEHGYFNNLTVKVMTTLISNTVKTGDINIELNSEATVPADSNGGGITLKRGTEAERSIVYDYPNDKWTINAALDVTDLTVNGSAVATSTTFEKAELPIKQIPTSSMVSSVLSGMTATSTIKEFLEAVFYPTLGPQQNSISGDTVEEFGGTINTYGMTVSYTVDATEVFGSGTADYDIGSGYQNPEATTLVISGAGDPIIFNYTHTFALSPLADNATFRVQNTFVGGGPLIATRALTFVARQFSLKSIAQPTVAEVMTANLGVPNSTSPKSQFSFVNPNNDNFYIVIPKRFNKYISSIRYLDSEGNLQANQLNGWEVLKDITDANSGEQTIDLNTLETIVPSPNWFMQLPVYLEYEANPSTATDIEYLVYKKVLGVVSNATFTFQIGYTALS